MTIMAFPYKRLPLFDAEEPLKAQNTPSWDVPYVPTKCTLTTDAFKWGPHHCYPGRNKTNHREVLIWDVSDETTDKGVNLHDA